MPTRVATLVADPSPRTRGTGRRQRPRGWRGGTIPARAGSRRTHRAASRPLRDHPRAGGEQAVNRLRLAGLRTIPACTRSSTEAGHCTPGCWDHPRMRGKQTWSLGVISGRRGPSPWARGWSPRVREETAETAPGSSRRAIPARTGSSCAPGRLGGKDHRGLLTRTPDRRPLCRALEMRRRRPRALWPGSVGPLRGGYHARSFTGRPAADEAADGHRRGAGVQLLSFAQSRRREKYLCRARSNNGTAVSLSFMLTVVTTAATPGPGPGPGPGQGSPPEGDASFLPPSCRHPIPHVHDGGRRIRLTTFPHTGLVTQAVVALGERTRQPPRRTKACTRRCGTTWSGAGVHTDSPASGALFRFRWKARRDAIGEVHVAPGPASPRCVRLHPRPTAGEAAARWPR